jgi:hypothetical protein
MLKMKINHRNKNNTTMKKTLRKLILVVSIIGAGALINTSFAQPRPGDPGTGGGGGGPIGGSAPIGSGLVMLLAMGLGYGAKKVYDARKASLNE